MNSNAHVLAALGWKNFFAAQVDPSLLTSLMPMRVMAVHRDRLQVLGDGMDGAVSPLQHDDGDDEAAATVGDWLLIDRQSLKPHRLLARRSLFKRRAPGTDRRVQLIAANVDVLFIVSSCNADFNVARLERYLALASEAEVMPVVILTKADLADDPETFARAARRLLPGLLVETLDARQRGSTACLAPWCAPGQTVALAGSSGVGKSTLVNTLTGTTGIATQGIREDDARGRHTTTGRMLHRLVAGGWLIDTPGMRELQLTDASAGIDMVFADIVELAGQCRFSNCRHQSEPGCAVQAAIATGRLDPDRLRRWRKLEAEEAHNSETLAERRARAKAFGKISKAAMRSKQHRQEGLL